MNEYITRQERNEDTFNLKKIVLRFLVYWYWYLISIILFVFLFLMKVRYATPMYKVHAQVMVEDNQSGGSSYANGGMMINLTGVTNPKNNIYNQLAILQTHDLVQQVVNNMQLNVSYYHKGSIRDVELYNTCPFQVNFIPYSNTIIPAVFEVLFSLSNKNSFVINSRSQEAIKANFGDTLHLYNGSYCITRTGMQYDADATYYFTIATYAQAADKIAGNLSSELMGTKATVINLTFNTDVPQKGEDVLKNVILAYTRRNLNEKNRISDSTIDFINNRIAIVSRELGGIEGNIQHFKQENKIADLSAQAEQLVTNSNEYYQKLNDVDVQLTVIKTMVAYLTDERNNFRPVPALFTSDAMFSGLLLKYNDLQVQRDRLLLSVKESNPIAANLNVQIANLRADLIKSLYSQQNAYQISKKQLLFQNSEVNSLIQNVPVQERQFLDLSREKELKQNLYLYLLQKSEETAISKAANMPNINIIESPKADLSPYAPEKNSALLTGLLLGLALPTGIILLRLALNNKILIKDDITAATSCTILAEVGHSNRPGVLSFEGEGRSVIAEQFRIFRTNMDFITADKKCPVILVTSSVSGEGKSFIASNLAQVYAYGGKKVLLMELDLRKPKLSDMFGLSIDAGFTSYIISNQPLSNFVKPIKNHPNLFIISSGSVPPNPAELLLSEKVSLLFNDLKKEYDVIIVDTPPAAAVTDAQILSRHSDVNLYVVRQKYSHKNSLEIVNDLMNYKKLNSLYLIVNDVKKGMSYGYGYQYAYALGEKKNWWQKLVLKK